MIFDCIIVGAGPAGITAALQLKRAGLSIALFEKGEAGGLLRNAYNVENYLGFPKGASGEKLISVFSEQLKDLAIEPIREEVVEVTEDNESFLAHTVSEQYRSIHVIIATGTVPKKTGMEGEELFAGTKLFYEIGDLPVIQDKSILIIGGGDVAFDYALNVHHKKGKPVIVMRSEPTCLPLLRKRVEENNIPCIQHTHPKLLFQSESELTLVCEREEFKAEYVLIAIGREPCSPPLNVRNTDNLYLAGDVKNGLHRQVHIAAGDGLRAAMDIIRMTVPTS